MTQREAGTGDVRERPILFSGEMVRAILDGRKTQTRRVMKPQPLYKNAESGWLWDRKGRGMEKPEGANFDPPYGFTQSHWSWLSPYGLEGHRLWVREAWRSVDACECKETCHVPGHVYFEADDSGYQGARYNRLRPSIHMPRWASRLTLEITNVRVERVQDISENDALDEGFSPDPWPEESTARGFFIVAWNAMNAKRGYGWDVNPWVWALSFRVIPTEATEPLAPVLIPEKPAVDAPSLVVSVLSGNTP